MDRFLVEISSAPSVADRIVLGFVSSLRSIRTNPLIGSLLQTEPTLLARSLGGEDGQMLTTATIRRSSAPQRAGNIPNGLNIDLTAEMMVRISASFLLVPGDVVDIDDDEQLAALARQFVPMVERVGE